MRYSNCMKHGFSLVELSIVLVILGLLTGGILAGQSLIRAAELRSVSNDFNRFTTAIYTFRDKYFAWPGDMNNAQKFWGVRAVGTDAVCASTINTTTGTCNGDGNGQIAYVTGDTSVSGEIYAAWQHLAYAGLIEGSYTGASGSAASSVRVPGTNVPPGKLSNSRFTIGYSTGPMSGDANFFDGPYGSHTISIGTNSGYVMKPEEAWNLDTKMDDGKPGMGTIWVYKATSVYMPNCATTDVAATSEYNLSNTSIVCSVLRSMR